MGWLNTTEKFLKWTFRIGLYFLLIPPTIAFVYWLPFPTDKPGLFYIVPSFILGASFIYHAHQYKLDRPKAIRGLKWTYFGALFFFVFQALQTPLMNHKTHTTYDFLVILVWLLVLIFVVWNVRAAILRAQSELVIIQTDEAGSHRDIEEPKNDYAALNVWKVRYGLVMYWFWFAVGLFIFVYTLIGLAIEIYYGRATDDLFYVSFMGVVFSVIFWGVAHGFLYFFAKRLSVFSKA